jgi:lipopolysaccharide transport system ATP-binding protein
MSVIRVENLSKEYVIGRRENRNDSFREMLADSFLAPVRRLRRLGGNAPENERFWALKDVSFEVEKGDVVGIVGKNGAGKSTLLKILSEVTEPTSGRIELEGRIGSLLEVGTGFHPELTGRENIFLNGAILGMSRAEIRKKFDEIVAFSEIERFLDTPVKRYSSGMYVRLAFSVAAHLEPEILVVDEVLAVGDARFQKKCIAKMEEVRKCGRTILFVSHNMVAVRSICERVLWLESGEIKRTGSAIDVTEEYLRHSFRADSLGNLDAIIASLPPDPALRLKGIEIRQEGRPFHVALNGLPLEIAIRYAVAERTAGLRIFFDVCDEEGKVVIRSFHDDDADVMPVVEPGEYVSTAHIPPNLLAPRVYELRLYGTIHNARSVPPGGIAVSLPVASNSGINRAYPHEPVRSMIQPKIPWDTTLLSPGPERDGRVP